MMQRTARAPDIESLEQMLDNAASDFDLSGRAIEIYDRLRQEQKKLWSNWLFPNIVQLQCDITDFEKVIIQIQTRRHPHVLDRYLDHINKSGGPIPSPSQNP